MKNIILIWLLFSLSNCDGQNKKNKTSETVNKPLNQIKKNTMEYYNENEYRNWQLDPEYCSPQFPCAEKDQSLMKETERVRIIIDEDKSIQVERSNIINPYKTVKVYSFKNKNLLNVSKDFYSVPVSYKRFDEKGKLIEEKDYNKPYKFSIKDLVEKIKKEYHINLEDKREKAFAGRRSKDGIYYYEVSIDKKVPLVTELKYILVDGNTGETLFSKIYHMKGNGQNPFDQYLETLNKK